MQRLPDKIGKLLCFLSELLNILQCVVALFAKKVLYTGHIGDGKIFVYDVENVVKVRTGEEGFGFLYSP